MLAAFLLVATTAPTQNPDVTVTARRPPTKPIRDAIGYFERHCFDASRLTGTPSSPRNDPDWHELTRAERLRFGVDDNAAPAFGSRYGDQALVFTLSVSRPASDLIEQRCTLIAAGGDQSRFADRIATLFGGPGTQRHLGQTDGIPARRGWRQLLWSATPPIGARRWQVATNDRGGDAWVLVVQPSFYDSMEYVLCDLRLHVEGAPLAKVTLIHSRRRRPGD